MSGYDCRNKNDIKMSGISLLFVGGWQEIKSNYALTVHHYGVASQLDLD